MGGRLCQVETTAPKEAATQKDARHSPPKTGRHKKSAEEMRLHLGWLRGLNPVQ